MTEKEKKIIEKQISVAQDCLNIATCEVDRISKLLHAFGYLYNATEVSEGIVFVPCDENFETLNALDEKYNLDELVKGGRNDRRRN
ncbi:MAG: hypothetical protein MJ196_05995 [Treponemataceae bacterium]|nr:hypothetical protein [Treponemataceae bacterium]